MEKINSLKIVHSCTSESFSGLEGYVLELMQWQLEQGLDVEFFCRKDTELYFAAKKKNIPLWCIEKNEGKKSFLKTTQGWRKRLEENHDQDFILHMHAGGEPLFHLFALTIPRIKKVLHYHIWINHFKKDPWHALMFYLIDEVWTSSVSSKRNLEQKIPIASERIKVVGYGRPVQYLLEKEKTEREQLRTEIRNRFLIPHSALLAICLSRIETIKGVRELFEAFCEVAKKHKQAYLLLIGDPSPHNAEASQLSNWIKAQHAALSEEIKARLILPGYLSPSENYLMAADFYVLPSYQECMSLAMLDALVLGLPVLGTNSGGTPSVVLEKPLAQSTGALLDVSSSKALQLALELKLENWFSDRTRFQMIKKTMSENARKVGSLYDRDLIFNQILNLYRSKLFG